MRNLINLFFPEKNENYSKAKSGLGNIKKKFDGFVLSFPDITPDEIMFVKEKWETLPKSISKGVKIMALRFREDCKCLLTSYDSNSYIRPHRHTEEYEHGVILKGQLIDKFRNISYTVGDSYVIEPNKIHYLSSTVDGCLVYSQLSQNKVHELEPLPKELLLKLEIA
jgi:quercetin dioxygenase-like cupin family protein